MNLMALQVMTVHIRDKALVALLGSLSLGFLFLSYHTGEQWRRYERDLDGMAIAPKAFTAPPGQLPLVPALESYGAIAATPVFHQTRQVYVVKNLADSAAIALNNLQHYTLIGIIASSSGQNKAFFKNQQSGETLTLTKDKQIEGCSVAGFSKIEVTLDCSHVEKKFAIREASGEVSVGPASAASGMPRPGSSRSSHRTNSSHANRLLNLPRQ